jgi:hypothetical protein
MPELKKLQQNDMMHYFAKEGVKSIQFAKHEVPDLKVIADDKDGGGGVKPPQISIYFYHPDHLGTNTIVTDMAGNTYQYFLNLPFGGKGLVKYILRCPDSLTYLCDQNPSYEQAGSQIPFRRDALPYPGLAAE